MSETGEYIRGCRYCSYKNKDRKMLRQHQIKCGSDKKYECHICHRRFDSESSISNHLSTHERESKFGSVSCIYCEKNFADSILLNEHLTIHDEFDIKLGPKNCRLSKCPHCSFIGMYKRLVNHVATHKEKSVNIVHKQSEYIRPCRYCPYKIEDRRLLREHEVKCGKDRPFECELCNRRFSLKQDLAKHIQCHERAKGTDVSCVYCHKTFKDKLILLEHLPIHEEYDCGKQSGTRSGVVCKCPHCGIVSERGYTHMVQHISTHTDNRTLECNLCQHKFIQKHSLQEHLAAHENAKVEGGVKCLINVLQDKLLLKIHLKTHDDICDEGRYYKCPECNHVASYYSNLEAHFVVHSGILKHKCPTCGKGFRNFCDVRIHQEAVHINTPRYDCKHCGLKLIHLKLRNDHEKTHLDSQGNAHFICQECGEDMKTAENFLAHYEAHNKFSCNYCSRGFATNAMRFRHMWTIHRVHIDNEADTSTEMRKLIEKELALCNLSLSGKTRPTSSYICEYCGKKTFNITAYKHHERSHTGERPFTCQLCGRGFTQDNARKKHEKTHEKPKSTKRCRDCNVEFEDSDALNTHILIHPDYKHHECNYCKERFAKDSQCKKHEKIHIGKRLTSCNICGLGLTDRAKQLRHMESHALQNKMDFSKNCFYCDVNISIDHLTFLGHLRSHDFDKKDSTYGCPYCNKRVKPVANFERHIIKHKKGHLSTERQKSYINPTLPDGRNCNEVTLEIMKNMDTTGQESNLENVAYETLNFCLETSQKSTLSLSSAVYQASLNNNNKQLLVWTKRLERDLLTIACGNPSICLVTKIEPHIQQKPSQLNKEQIKLNDTEVLTLWSSGDVQEKLSKKEFSTLKDLEREISRKNDIIHFVRQSNENTMRRLLNDNVNRNIIVTNYM